MHTAGVNEADSREIARERIRIRMLAPAFLPASLMLEQRLELPAHVHFHFALPADAGSQGRTGAEAVQTCLSLSRTRDARVYMCACVCVSGR